MSPILRLARLVIDDPRAAVSMASRIVTAASAKRQRVLAKSKPRRETEGRAEALADVRHRILVRLVEKRADGACELCGGSMEGRANDIHHLEMGSAKTKNERLSNVMIAHHACHRAYHLNAAAFVGNVKDWCARHGYPLPSRKEYRAP